MNVQDVGDEVLVLDRAGNQLHHLNATASWIYRRCDGESTARSIIDELLANFDVEPSLAEADAMEVLDQLRQLGLIAFDASLDDGPMAQQLLEVPLR